MPTESSQSESDHDGRLPAAPSRMRDLVGRLGSTTHRFGGWLNSPPGRGVLKCTIAYTIASLWTFVPLLSAFLGDPGGKHVVATITVYFHPARSAGSMIEAALIAAVAVLYAELVSLLSMVTSVLVGSAGGMPTVAHILVVVIFIGGGFGFMGWVKQTMENPLVNVASTLASLAIISVVTKENAVVENVFSNQKLVQVLKMLVIGISSTVAVNLLVWRTSARALLRRSMTKVSLALADTLSLISTGFISGSEGENETSQAELSAALSAYSSLHPQMTKNLREAKFEHHLVGTEKIYVLEESIARSMEALAQSAGGLRSAWSTLFALLKAHLEPALASHVGEEDSSQPTTEIPDSSRPCTPQGFFDIFMGTVESSMSSLTAGLCRALREPQIGRPDNDMALDNSVAELLSQFKGATEDALHSLYNHPALLNSGSVEMQMSLEQVAAACGHFAYSLQSMAEEVHKHLDLLDSLSYTTAHEGRSWRWAVWWMKGGIGSLRLSSEEEEGLLRPVRRRPDGSTASDPIDRSVGPAPTWRAASGASKLMATLSRHVLSFFKNLARDDILFGLKVGIGAALWATLSFLDATRDIYSHYRGEWGLLSFMIVCSMTVGASNTTGTSRFIGTLVGAIFSLINWGLSRGNAFVLLFLGWLVSFWNFYLIVAGGRAPLGRMTQLAYNVSVLYAYSLGADLDNDDGNDEGGGGEEPIMVQIVKHRVLSVTCGILWGLIVCRGIWPISARQKFKEGISMLFLQMGLIWKRGPLAILLRSGNSQTYIRSDEQAAMKRLAGRLAGLRQSAVSEFELRGPFPFASTGRVLRSSDRILDAFYAMSLITQRSGHLTSGERALLKYTAPERTILCDRICHIFQVISSSMMLEYPFASSVPNIVALRNNLLRKVFQFRKSHDNQRQEEAVKESDYALLYAYVLVTGQVAEELKLLEKEVEGLYGVLEENSAMS